MSVQIFLKQNIVEKLNTQKLKKYLLSFIFIFIFLPLVLFAYFNLFYIGRIYPNTHVGQIDVSGKSKNEAEKIIKENILLPNNISFLYNNQQFDLPLSAISFSYNVSESVNQAYNAYRKPNLLVNLLKIVKSPFNKKGFDLLYSYNKGSIDVFLTNINDSSLESGIEANVSLLQGEIKVFPGKNGEIINKTLVYNAINDNFANNNIQNIPLFLEIQELTISPEMAVLTHNRATLLLNKNLHLYYEDVEMLYSQEELIAFIDPKNSYKSSLVDKEIIKISSEVNREPENPIFVFSEGKVEEFSPSKDGLKVQNNELYLLFTENLEKLEREDQNNLSLEIPVKTKKSEYQTGDVNNFGITSLIGKGVSYFKGSISSRIHNVGLASSKLTGILIAPNETFSFNTSLGDVSSLTGYKQAYIIKDGKTILGDGGGVCQVSTTLFRAALDAGIPITERHPHSYRVGYYEQQSPPGIDATVYDPSADLKFKNDTPGHLLIQAAIDKTNNKLTFELFGTSDGRISTISKSVVTGVTPPPEDLYVDDPTLPLGQIKQIDWKAWGAKVWFDYQVEKDGEIVISKRFYSNYRPWQAIFLRGTAPQ